MSDQSDFPREMPPLVNAKPAGPKTFEYFSTHIVAISALATLCVGLGSTCMLFGYVFTLDRDLLRLVQYSDVLQFGLETVVFLGFGLAFVSLAVATNVIFSPRHIIRTPTRGSQRRSFFSSHRLSSLG
jgi:hypothetical protein